MARARGGRWIVGALVGLALLAAAGLGLSTWLFSQWARVRTVEPAEAEQAFVAALARSGGGRPYIEISGDGAVSVHREMEGAHPVPVQALHLVALEPGRRQIVEVAFPFWLVRAKLTGTLNAGTLTTLVAGDWANLDLRVTGDDLRKRGPGLILDHHPTRGGRILLWTE